MRRLLGLQHVLFLLIAAVSVNAQTAQNREVEFGVNGHPLNAGSYYNLSLEQQVSLLKTLGLKTYRVNINPAHTEKFGRLSEWILLAERDHIRVLPVIVLPPKQYSDENTAYEAAKGAVYKLVRQFETKVSVWELGNEYDLYCVKNNDNGDSLADYDPAKYAVVRGLIRGMLTGLHEASPSSRSIVQTTQHTSASLDSGFLKRLIQDGIAFDITGYHYYSSNGRVPTAGDGRDSLKVLHDTFHKPIWITEFDKSSITPTLGPGSDPREQAKALRAALSELAADADRYGVIGADIYELLDEPELLKNPDVPPSQAQFGILDGQGHPTEASVAVRDFLRDHWDRAPHAFNFPTERTDLGGRPCVFCKGENGAACATRR